MCHHFVTIISQIKPGRRQTSRLSPRTSGFASLLFIAAPYKIGNLNAIFHAIWHLAQWTWLKSIKIAVNTFICFAMQANISWTLASKYYFVKNPNRG